MNEVILLCQAFYEDTAEFFTLAANPSMEHEEGYKNFDSDDNCYLLND